MYYWVKVTDFGSSIRSIKGKVQTIEEIPNGNLPLFILQSNSVVSQETRKDMREVILKNNSPFYIAVESLSPFFPMGVKESRFAPSRGGAAETELIATKVYDCKPSSWLAVLDCKPGLEKTNSFVIVRQKVSGNQFSSSVYYAPVWEHPEYREIALNVLKGDVYWKLD